MTPPPSPPPIPAHVTTATDGDPPPPKSSYSDMDRNSVDPDGGTTLKKMAVGWTCVTTSSSPTDTTAPPLQITEDHSLSLNQRVQIVGPHKTHYDATMNAVGVVTRIEEYSQNRGYGVTVKLTGYNAALTFPFASVECVEIHESRLKRRMEKERAKARKANPAAAAQVARSAATLSIAPVLTQEAVAATITAIMLKVWGSEDSAPFRDYADDPEYCTGSEYPMCLRDIGELLDAEEYLTVGGFEADFRTVLANFAKYFKSREGKGDEEAAGTLTIHGRLTSLFEGLLFEPPNEPKKKKKQEKKRGRGSGGSEVRGRKSEARERGKVVYDDGEDEEDEEDEKGEEGSQTGKRKAPTERRVPLLKTGMLVNREIDVKGRTKLPVNVLKSNCLENLADYIDSLGGDRDEIVNRWTVSMDIRKGGDSVGARDYYFWNEEEKKFRSRVQVARFLELAEGHLESKSGPGSRVVKRGTKKRKKDHDTLADSEGQQYEVEAIHGMTVLPGPKLGLQVEWKGYSRADTSEEPYDILGDVGQRHLLNLATEDIPAKYMTLVREAQKWAWEKFVYECEEFKGKEGLVVPFREEVAPEEYVGLEVLIDFDGEMRPATIVGFGNVVDAPFWKAKMDDSLEDAEEDFDELDLDELIDGWKAKYCD